MKTVEYLDAVKAAFLLTSDYQLAKKLAVSTNRIGNYRSGRNIIDDEMALKIALLLDSNPLRVLADAHAERAERKGDELMYEFWHDIAVTGKCNSDKLSQLVA